MATITEEFEILKIRIGKREGDQKITIVDHVNATQISCTVKEGFEALKARISKEEGGHIIHVVDHVAVQRRKLEPGNQTRFGLDCGTNDAYRELYAEWIRILTEVKNKTMAIDFFTRGVRAVTKEVMDEWRNEGREPQIDPDF